MWLSTLQAVPMKLDRHLSISVSLWQFSYNDSVHTIHLYVSTILSLEVYDNILWQHLDDERRPWQTVVALVVSSHGGLDGYVHNIIAYSSNAVYTMYFNMIMFMQSRIQNLLIVYSDKCDRQNRCLLTPVM